MTKRPFWIKQIIQAWEKRPIVWLSGVRRVGKTTLAKMFKDAHYLNCDLPSVIRLLEDPEHLKVFRSIYPQGKNFLISPQVKTSYKKTHDDLIINFCSVDKLMTHLAIKEK